jgi:hypothetical protein
MYQFANVYDIIALLQDGEFHALKIFEPYAVKDINREVAALQKLKHENIIQFIGVEHEVKLYSLYLTKFDDFLLFVKLYILVTCIQ